MTASRTYRVGLIGNCCTHGEFVAAALHAEPRAEIAAAWETDPRRAPALAEATGCALSDTAERIIDDPAIDIVALATSPHEKARWVEHAAAAGKHIFLNKPMCESPDAARRIERAVGAAGIKLVHDISVIRFHPITARIIEQFGAGAYGRPISYVNSWGMTFSADFPLATHWPERLDPPEKSGGGELTNLGCYAIDYMLALFGMPRAVIAQSTAYWQPYDDAGVENFGQVVAEYDGFFAMLSAGKQTMDTLPSMDVAAALDVRNWYNMVELRCEHHNLTVMPFAGVLIQNGEAIVPEAWLTDYDCPTPFQQLITSIETDSEPASNATVARQGVEVLAAAYQSVRRGGARILLAANE